MPTFQRRSSRSSCRRNYRPSIPMESALCRPGGWQRRDGGGGATTDRSPTLDLSRLDSSLSPVEKNTRPEARPRGPVNDDQVFGRNRGGPLKTGPLSSGKPERDNRNRFSCDAYERRCRDHAGASVVPKNRRGGLVPGPEKPAESRRTLPEAQSLTVVWKPGFSGSFPESADRSRHPRASSRQPLAIRRKSRLPLDVRSPGGLFIAGEPASQTGKPSLPTSRVPSRDRRPSDESGGRNRAGPVSGTDARVSVLRQLDRQGRNPGGLHAGLRRARMSPFSPAGQACSAPEGEDLLVGQEKSGASEEARRPGATRGPSVRRRGAKLLERRTALTE